MLGSSYRAERPNRGCSTRADFGTIGGPGASVGGSGRFEPDRRRAMPRAYSADLRERVLAAYEGGGGSQSTMARRYRVGERTLSAWLRTAREEGRRSPRPLGGEREALVALVAERNDATLAEYADLLAERAGVRRSPSALCRVLKALGLVRKKRPSRLPNRTAGTSPRRGGRGGAGRAGGGPPPPRFG